MKRVVLISAVVVIGALSVILVASCKEKDGVYNPKGKISKIYYEDYVMYEGTAKPVYTQPKELVEVWTWDKKKLMQIESKEDGYTWALQFVYKGNQVQEIKSGDDIFKFTYDDKTKLKKIEVVDEQSRPKLNITVVERNGDNKITRLTYEQFTYTEDPSEKALLRKLRPVANIMMGENVGETMVNGMEENVKMRKATTTVTTQVELTYEGNNVSEERRIITIGSSAESMLIKYKYDNKSNPYYLALALMYDSYLSSARGTEKLDALFATTSENNVESYTTYNPNAAKPEIAIDTVQFVYKYNSDGFPTERDKIKEGVMPNLEATKYTAHKVYYYEYITK